MTNRGLRASIGALTILSMAGAAGAQSLQTIHPSGGGEIVYGQVQGAVSEAAAMGVVLRQLHNSLGKKPRVGKLFQVRDTGSYAVFLSCERKDQGQGMPPMQVAGLLIATKVSDGDIEAALISDEFSRFPKTVGPMSKTLFASWHPFPTSANGQSIGSGSNSNAVSGAVAPLHTAATQDHSASLKIPDGWRMQGNGGTILASGPQGESAWMGLAFLAGDTNNPNIQRIMQQVRSGQLRAPAYVNANYIPYGTDVGKTFVALMQTAHKKAGFLPANYNITGVSPGPWAGGGRCTHIQGTVDFSDGKGQRELDAAYCIHPPSRMGTWASEVYMTTVPRQHAATDRSTLAAVMTSYQYDPRIVGAEAHQIAGPEIGRIVAVAKAAKIQSDQAHAREDYQISKVEKYWDNNDKQSQAFANLQRGYSVVGTADDKYHGTFWNEDAASLVESNPDKFQYVPTPNFWKGIDY